MAKSSERPLKVLRVFHAGVVSEWRERDRSLRRRGVDLTLASARSWNEGGAEVALTADGDAFVVPVRTYGVAHPYLFAYSPLALWRLLRSARFDVLDVHEEPASLAAAQLVAFRRLFARQATLTLYSAQNIDKRYPPPFRWFERAALRAASAVYCCNEAAAEVLARKGFTGVVEVVGLGVSTGRFAPSPTSSRPGRLRLGYVGRLERHKGVHVLLEAVAATVGVELEVVGDGPERAALVADALRLGIADRVTFGGFARHAELPEVYRRFDVVVVPSLPTAAWVEQFGRVAVEAMASGVPVVVSDSGALPEVVREGGLFVPPGDVGALAETLALLAEDPDVRSALTSWARERAATYDWDAIAAAHHDLYDRVVA